MPSECVMRLMPDESSASIAHVVPWRSHTRRSMASAASPSAWAALIVEQMDRVGLGAEAAGCSPRRAAVGGPHGLAITIDGDAVRAAPGPLLLRQLPPIADDAIGIGAAVDRRDILRDCGIQGHAEDRRRHCPSHKI